MFRFPEVVIDKLVIFAHLSTDYIIRDSALFFKGKSQTLCAEKPCAVLVNNHKIRFVFVLFPKSAEDKMRKVGFTATASPMLPRRNR